MRVSPGSTKIFYLVDYFYGKRIWLKFGRYLKPNLAQARTKAHKALAELEKGIHPTHFTTRIMMINIATFLLANDFHLHI